MVRNEAAIYEGKLWCAYELKNKYGIYDEELRLFMRKESQNNKFQCPDCGERLILCAGPIMEPFFKHHEGSRCVTKQGFITKVEFCARRILYHLAKESFPNADIRLHQRIEGGYIPNILIINENSIIALMYLSSDMKLEEWEKEHLFYCENNIKDIWFLNYSRYYDDRLTTFEYLISKTEGTLKLLDIRNNRLILKEKFITNYMSKDKVISKAYEWKDVRIDKDGSIVCDYRQLCMDAMTDINKMEENIVLRDSVTIRHQEAYKKEKSVNQISEYKKQVKQVKALIASKEEKKNLKQVIRTSLSNVSNMAGKMRMTSINEAWELPVLIGTQRMIKSADNQRFQYLKRLDRQLRSISNSFIKDQKINEAISKLESNLHANYWRNKI